MKPRRFLIRSLQVAGTAFGLLLLLGMAAWLGFGAQRLTLALEQRLAEAVGGEVHIAGGLEPILWCRPGLALRELRVSGRSGAPQEIHAERLEIRFDLRALWRRFRGDRPAFLDLRASDVALQMASEVEGRESPAAKPVLPPWLGAMDRFELTNLAVAGLPAPWDELRVDGLRMARTGEAREVALSAEAHHDARPVSLTARIPTPAGPAKLVLKDLDLRVDRYVAHGRIQIDWSGERPALKASLSSQSLDFSGAAGGAEDRGNGGGPGIPLSRLLLDQLEIDLHYHVAAATWGSWTLREIEGSAQAKPGKTALALVAQGLFGGMALETSLSGEIAPPTLEAHLQSSNHQRHRGEPSGSATGKAETEKASRPEAAKAPKGPRAETLQADVHLSGRGARLGNAVASASGRIAFGLERYSLNDPRIRLIGAGLFALPLRFWFPHEKESLVECGVVHLEAEEGVAHSTGVLFRTDQLTVGGKGVLRLQDRSVDFVLRPRTNRVGLVTVPVLRLRGPPTAPTVKPQRSGLAIRLAESGVLAAVDPLLIAVPFVDLGVWDRNPCAEALAGEGHIRGYGGTLFDHLEHGIAEVARAVAHHHAQHHPPESGKAAIP